MLTEQESNGVQESINALARMIGECEYQLFTVCPKLSTASISDPQYARDIQLRSEHISKWSNRAVALCDARNELRKLRDKQ